MKVLFISRAHPPVIGGIENQNEAVGRWLSKKADCRLIINRFGKRFLPVFLPYAVVRGLVRAREVDAVLLGDGVLTFAGFILKLVYPKKPVVCIVHGLDITYKNIFYQKLWVGYFFSKIDKYIAVSRSTAEQLSARGIPDKSIEVIPNGIDLHQQEPRVEREKLSAMLGIDVTGRKVILTLGRLVKRKGVDWFLTNVVPMLPGEVLYVIAGDGPESGKIESILHNQRYAENVVLMGEVSEANKRLLLSSCDIFIQPNIEVPGDVEGFGVVVIEAGIHGLPVVASNLEGLKDSVTDGENGWHVEPGDARGFADRISVLLSDPLLQNEYRMRARSHVTQKYDWNIVVDKYLSVLGREIEGF